MKYKLSKYNYFYKQDENTYTCINLIDKSIFGLDIEKYNIIQKHKENPIFILEINPNLFSALCKLGVIIDEDIDEISYLITEHRKAVYSTDTFQLTILPTLECNFKCWYCYEERINGQMSDETQLLIIEYLKKNVFNTAIKYFHLDWFGGEPLICFENVVFPFSIKVKELCNKFNVQFNNTITTNGALINSNMIQKFKLIDLTGFQITLDGNENHHNKIKKGKNNQNVYKTTIANILEIIDCIENTNFLLRINYTEKNINGLTDIINDIPEKYRNRIEIGLQQVWQTQEGNNNIDATICNNEFVNSGFIAPLFKIETKFYRCYADLLSQLVINYNGDVFKCTARDFANHKPDGSIKDDEIIWNSIYYKRMASTTIEKENCINCNFLPACWGPCSQKLLEYKEGEFEKICNIDGIEKTIQFALTDFYKKKILTT